MNIKNLLRDDSGRVQEYPRDACLPVLLEEGGYREGAQLFFNVT